MIVQDVLIMNGKKVKDNITGFEGIVVGILFDVNGCILASVCPPTDKDGKRRDSEWFDVKRLGFFERVIPAPTFGLPLGEEAGPSHLPIERRLSAPR